MHVIHRQTCRICGSRSLKPVIDIGEQNLQGAFIKGDDIPPGRTIRTKLVRCDPSADEKACGLLQLGHTVPARLLYSSYWYRSGINTTMRNHLKGIVAAALPFAEDLRPPNAIVRVLDIGCNDGTLLKEWPADYFRLGVDPSQIARQEIRAPLELICDTFPTEALAGQPPHCKFDVITSIAMFYDLENPVEFVQAIAENLSLKGIWIVEMSYMPTMLTRNMYDTICHEHIEYYSLAVLENLFARANLKIFRSELNESNGGSLRCFVCFEGSIILHQKDGDEDALDKLRQAEFDMELDTDRPYLAFQKRISDLAGQLFRALEIIKREGKCIHIYGASTKGNTILQYSRLDPDWIAYAAERNPEKVGAKLIFGEIEIISEEESRSLQPDFYLVLPWHFREEILARETAELNRGATFIFPLPRLEMVGGPNVF